MTFFEVTAKSAFGSRKVDQEGFEPSILTAFGLKPKVYTFHH